MFKTIMWASDGSEHSDRALDYVRSLAEANSGSIIAVHVKEITLGRAGGYPVQVDEVIGQLIVFLFIPFTTSWLLIGAAFLLFRLFDIWKPYPIRRLEALESGLGIMADDVLAGVYALIANSALISIYLLLVS